MRIAPHLLAPLVWLASLPALSSAHPLAFTETIVVLRTNGTFQADLIVDLDALALGAPQDADDASLVATLTALGLDDFEDRLRSVRRLFERRVRLRFDGSPAPFEVDFPDHGTPAATESPIPTVLGLTARLTGTIPPGATELEFFASRAFSEVDLTIQDQLRNVTRRTLLEPGARSAPFLLTGEIARPSALSVSARYLQFGFVHIIPRGLDHILFVLGLFLLGAQLRALVWQITAFTLAHAVTLSLAVLEVVSLPAHLVEPLIALSIVYVAAENMLTDRLRFWRPVLVFGFGLLHGLGFAGVLQELGLPDQEFWLGLFGFNIGIELGQLTVIVAALIATGWCRHRPWYRTRVAVPGSCVIAAIGLYWTTTRVLGL